MSEPRLPYYRAPAGLRDRVASALRAAPPSAAVPMPAAPVRGVRQRPVNWWLGMAAAVLLLIPTALLLRSELRSDRSATSNDVAAAIDGHLRSLMPGHLADVASTDQHTVKPWFTGRLSFSPPVHDLAAAGFPLIGGRVDVLDGETVAALVYSRHGHLVNLFIRPSRGEERVPERTDVSRGITIVAWTQHQTRFWAVSDLRLIELEQLRALISAAERRDGASRR